MSACMTLVILSLLFVLFVSYNLAVHDHTNKQAGLIHLAQNISAPEMAQGCVVPHVYIKKLHLIS